MTRLPLAMLLLAGLAAPASMAAAPQPKWTAKGAITVLRLHSITVHDQTCRITTASPSRATLRLYGLGIEAKIACANGVLRAIDPLHPPTVIKVPAPVYPSRTPGSSDASLLMSQTATATSSGLISISNSVGGGAPITALTDTSITAGAGPVSLTCSIGAGSPDLGGLAAGDRVSSMNCKNGVLTSITRAG